MPNEPLRLAFVGPGNCLHISFGPVMQFVDGLEVVAAVDASEDALALARSEYGIEKGYRSLEECLDQERLDVALIATPVYLHRDHAVLCAERGVHVLLEKPMARTPVECDEIIAAHEKAGTVLMVAFMKRYNRCMLKVEELLQDGAIGQVTGVRHNWDWGGVESAQFGTHWRGQLNTWGGQFQDHGSHSVDLAMWWAGPVRSVMAAIDIVEPGWEVENEYHVVCTHESGARSVHLSSKFYHREAEEHYLIFGETGTIELRHCAGVWAWQTPYELYLHRFGHQRENLQPPFSRNWLHEGRDYGQYKLELDHFAECARTGQPPRTPGSSGRAVIEVINAAYLSQQEGRRIDLPLAELPDHEALFRGLERHLPPRYREAH